MTRTEKEKRGSITVATKKGVWEVELNTLTSLLYEYVTKLPSTKHRQNVLTQGTFKIYSDIALYGVE